MDLSSRQYKKGETFHEVLGQANLVARGKPVDCKKVANNTILRRVYPSEDINLELHGNVIATFLKSGGMVVSSCGYQTVTTKDRLRQVLPSRVGIYADKGVWHVAVLGPGMEWATAKRYLFVDGMIVMENGKVQGAPLAPAKAKKGANNA